MVIAASKDAKLAILVRLKYGIQLSPLVVCQVRRQGCKELPLRSQSGFGTKTFQNREPGNDYRPPAQFLDGRSNQCDPTIGLQSSGQQPRSKRAVLAESE